MNRPASALRRAPRGLTLIELMVTLVVASVIVSAAVAVFISLSRQLRSSERRLEASSSAVLANAILQLDLGNTGYRFPNPAFALRHYNNVDGTVSLSGPAPITTTGECAGATVGLVPGSDVLQVAQGYEPVGPGRVLAQLTSAFPEYELGLGTLGEPFETAEYVANAGAGAIVMLSGPDQRACLGRVLSLDGTKPSITIELVDRNLTRITNAAAYPAQCPLPGGAATTRVYRLQRFVRYLVCGDATQGPERRALYRQESDRNGVFAAPQVMQDGVEDLQVSPLFSDPTSTISASGSGASCFGAAGIRSCYCDDDATPSCSVPVAQLEPTLGNTLTLDTVDDPLVGVWVSRVRGARMVVTGISQRTAQEIDQGFGDDLRRPVALDHPGMAVSARDGFYRVQQQSTLRLNNLGIMP